MTHRHMRTTWGCSMQCLENESGRNALVCLMCASRWTLVGVLSVTLLGCFVALSMPPMLHPAFQVGSPPQPAAWVQRQAWKFTASWVRLYRSTHSKCSPTKVLPAWLSSAYHVVTGGLAVIHNISQPTQCTHHWHACIWHACGWGCCTHCELSPVCAALMSDAFEHS